MRYLTFDWIYTTDARRVFFTQETAVCIKVYFTAGKQPCCKIAWHNWESNFFWGKKKIKMACFSAVARTALKQCLFDEKRNIFLVISEPVFARQYTPISFTITSIVLPWALFLFLEDVSALQLLSHCFLFILICRFTQELLMVLLL